MKYWLDTEFIERGHEHPIDLISIGIVSEDDREFYAESAEVDLSVANDWVKANVIPVLWSKRANKLEANLWLRDVGSGGLLSRRDMAFEVRNFCHPETYGSPQFWGEWYSYDWVVFAQIFGTMVDLPEGFPMRVNDVMQYAEHLGIAEEDLPPTLETEGNYHALLGAQSVRRKYLWLEHQELNSRGCQQPSTDTKQE